MNQCRTYHNTTFWLSSLLTGNGDGLEIVDDWLASLQWHGQETGGISLHFGRKLAFTTSDNTPSGSIIIKCAKRVPFKVQSEHLLFL